MQLDERIRAWIGRSWERCDVISERLVAEFRASFSPYLAAGPSVPLGIFWCLSPDIVSADDLGPDGHPRLGMFLPELPLPRRMWAGGELEFFGQFSAGDPVTKRSTITGIEAKSGKSGDLCFVTVRNEYRAAGELVIRERQDIVYRAASSLGSRAGALRETGFDPPAGCWTIATTPTLLFRYSAMTFNSHRIHYDEPYATGTEGYAGLVVHGPLQVTLLINRAAEVMGRLPRQFAYRGQSPLICGTPFHVMAEQAVDGGLAVKAVAADGTATMSAVAA